MSSIMRRHRGTGASERELEALAIYMGHSLEMQRGSYDRQAPPPMTLLHLSIPANSFGESLESCDRCCVFLGLHLYHMHWQELQALEVEPRLWGDLLKLHAFAVHPLLVFASQCRRSKAAKVEPAIELLASLYKQAEQKA